MARLKNSQNAFAPHDAGVIDATTHKGATPAGEGKIPVGWALLVLGLGCAAFWGAVGAIL